VQLGGIVRRDCSVRILGMGTVQAMNWGVFLQDRYEGSDGLIIGLGDVLDP
jgi:hypothetical protein